MKLFNPVPHHFLLLIYMTFAVFILSALRCVSHSTLLDDEKLPIACKMSLECWAYNEKNPTACTNTNDLCSWVTRQSVCSESSLNPVNTENGKYSKREIFLDCMSRTK